MSLEHMHETKRASEGGLDAVLAHWDDVQSTLSRIPPSQQGLFFEAFKESLQTGEHSPKVIDRALAASFVLSAGEGNREAADELYRLAGLLSKTKNYAKH